jgi:hypothetical protein
MSSSGSAKIQKGQGISRDEACPDTNATITFQRHSANRYGLRNSRTGQKDFWTLRSIGDGRLGVFRWWCWTRKATLAKRRSCSWRRSVRMMRECGSKTFNFNLSRLFSGHLMIISMWKVVFASFVFYAVIPDRLRLPSELFFSSLISRISFGLCYNLGRIWKLE